MSTAIAVLSYNRLPILKTCLAGLKKYASQHQTAVFEDSGYFDDTRGWMTRPVVRYDKFQQQIEAEEYVSDTDPVRYFLGTRNLGVAGNSNRAIHWFMTQTTADHLCLCNDDILVQGDFATVYKNAHDRMGIGLLCLMPFDHSDMYKPSLVTYRGLRIKLCPRMTGIMMSFTRQCLEDIGYFDMKYGRFGEEHNDVTHRARFMGHVSLDGQPQSQIDIVQNCVSYQECGTSVSGVFREQADAEASRAHAEVVNNYKNKGCYREFATERPRCVGAPCQDGIIYDRIDTSYPLISNRASLAIY